MQNLKRLLQEPLRQPPTSLVVSVLIIALLGFADAAYLTAENYRGIVPPCTVGGCEVVLTSAFSEIGGVPIALGGVLYYLLILVLVFAALEGRKQKFLRWALILTPLGFLASLFLLYVQAFILHAYCLYCLGSAITSTLLFVLAVVIFKKYSVKDVAPPELPI